METSETTVEHHSIFYSPLKLAWAAIKSVRLWFLLIIGAYCLTYVFELPKQAEKPARILLVIFSFLQVGITANVLARESLERFVTSKATPDSSWHTAKGLISFGLQGILWSLVLLLALDNLGIDITALVTGLGIGGIAAALAINNILGDLFASLSIILDKPFVVGDFIVVGDLSGTVERIGIKSTRIRSLSGEQIVFSNSDLLSSRIRNYKRMLERRILFQVGVIYETPSEKLKAIPGWIKEIVERQSQARFDRAHLKSFGAYSLDFEVVYFMLTPDYLTYMDTQQAINQALFDTFLENKVEFAYPTQVEYHKKAS